MFRFCPKAFHKRSNPGDRAVRLSASKWGDWFSWLQRRSCYHFYQMEIYENKYLGKNMDRFVIFGKVIGSLYSCAVTLVLKQRISTLFLSPLLLLLAYNL